MNRSVALSLYLQYNMMHIVENELKPRLSQNFFLHNQVHKDQDFSSMHVMHACKTDNLMQLENTLIQNHVK